MMNVHNNGKAAAYVIDENLRIVHANEELQRIIPNMQYGKCCYEIICGESGPCINCPLKNENQGKAIVYSHLHGGCFSASSAEIEWPGTERGHIILIDDIRGKYNPFYYYAYNAIGKSNYEELLELDYLNDTYKVISHSKRRESNASTTGQLSTMVHYVAERIIHPDDQQHFYDFWALERIGKEVAPKELFQTRKGEFRRHRADGGYDQSQQIFMPARQGADGKLFIMSFHNRFEHAEEAELHIGVLSELEGSGLFDRQHFFEAVEQVLNADEGRTTWCLLSIDIENMKLFNEWYGREEGDALIAGVANCLQKIPGLDNSIVGYFGNDDFGLMMPYDDGRIETLNGELGALLEMYSNKIGFLPSIGVYEITDPGEPAYTMYDRAELARGAIKGNYSVRIKKYDRGMLESITSKYILFSDVKQALRDREFTFFLQPKCNIENGKIVGAEALVRWINKNGEMISPGVFIPFLEKSGFIAELDPYIWEEVCKWQRSMLDNGLETVPVSVNVSRVDIYAMDVPACFDALVRKYNLDPRLLEIEITESTYTDDNHYIGKVVSELRRLGFCVLMDDFGSGYSSLNMLKDVEVDILKLDMRFLQLDENNESKGAGILRAVHNMARLMGTDIIVEGVETEAQKRFLQNMSCGYAQGYYFYRPMPVRDFENEIKNTANLDHEDYQDRSIERICLKDLLSEDMFSEIMINNMLGAVAFYEVYQDEVILKRYNDLYANLVGNPGNLGSKLNFRKHHYEEDIPIILKMFRDARKNQFEGSEGEIRRVRPDGFVLWMHLRTFFLKEQDGHEFYYSTIRDVTDIYQKNQALKEQNLALRFLNDDMPGGYFRYENSADADLLFISPRFLDMIGFTREEIKERFQDKYINIIHPEDRELFHQSTRALAQNGGDYSLTYRVQHKNGYIVVTEQSRYVEYEEHQFFQGILLYDLHQTWPVGDAGCRETDSQFDLNYVPCGIYQVEADGEHRFRYISNSLLAMLGYTRQGFLEKFKCSQDLIDPDDILRINQEFSEQMQHSPYVSCEHRIEMVDGNKKWVYSRSRLVVDDDGKRLFNVCVMDYDYLKSNDRLLENTQCK